MTTATESIQPNLSPVEIMRRFQQTAPVDVIGFARACGLEVYHADGDPLPKNASGMILKNDKGGPSGYSIIVRNSEPETRKRFTIAHEIAHFLLHRDAIHDELIDDVKYRSGLSDLHEIQANRLAAEILMPRHLIRQATADMRMVNTGELAKLFKVSPVAMGIQIRQLYGG